jgi:dTDP-glucose pyrophosphorylase
MKNWESALIGPAASLEEAISAMDETASRISLIVDDERHLLGTLTDGDVRRALLKHLPLSTPVEQAMCRTPQVAQTDWSRARMLSVMESRQLIQLPVVDSAGRVIGLETVHDLLEKQQCNNPVFLMAGGFGTRLHPLTHDCPKPLLKVGEKPILELILENFIKAGFHRFYISTHYLPEMVREHFGDGSQWGVSINYTHEEIPLGTGGALGLLPQEDINEPLIVMNGDLLTTLNFRELLSFHLDHASEATMCVRKYEYQVPYGVIKSEGNLIQSMVEKPTYNFFVNAGIYVLSPELIRKVKRDTKIDMPTLLEQSIQSGGKVTMFPMHEYWLDIGRMEDFRRAQLEFGEVFG